MSPRQIAPRRPRAFWLWVLYLACSPALLAQEPVHRIAADLRYLAADEREGRGLGSPGIDSAAAYIAAQMSKAGLIPGGTEGYFQEFTVDSTAPAVAHAGLTARRGKNVIGILPGQGALAGQAVVVGAHYDHLGRGGFGSLEPESTGVVHNGADDNASGTAALLEVARKLAAPPRGSRRTVVFIAFSGEELGLLGSAHYVRHPVVPIESTYAMINFDMVGRLTNRRVTVFGTETAKEFSEILDSAAHLTGLEVVGSGDGFGRSDQSSFFAVNIPVLHFFTGVHQDYHRTTDDVEKINVEGISRIAEMGAMVVGALAARQEPLTFVPGKPPPVSGGGYGAYLGTVPDMTESPGGVRLSGVRSGSPAEQAGLRPGDILVGLGDYRIANLYDMTNALRAYQPGDTVSLKVLRDGKPVELKAVLGRRGG
ncbi:MAG: aminopeptidase [Gemmatimonadales bacterium]|nr:MAG: aminopeptidase [Gemmatimonadales bacterium]